MVNDKRAIGEKNLVTVPTDLINDCDKVKLCVELSQLQKIIMLT